MLTEERHSIILNILSRQRTASLSELCAALDTSESTVRRDIAVLAENGLLSKIRGGAMAAAENFSYLERNVEEKASMYAEEKTAIAKYAASLIEDGDFVFLDAGTTAAKMIDYIPQKSVGFVTNAFMNAKKLALRGFKVHIVAGEVKPSTEAIVGEQAVSTLSKYNFTKCFMGVNGISVKGGFSTPDSDEAAVKAAAIAHSKMVYVLADRSKFDNITAVRFGELKQAIIITDKIPSKKYLAAAEIKEVM